MPILDVITIRGFKSIAVIERLPLHRVNVIIGANGAGKSNFIGAFTFLHRIERRRLENYVLLSGGAERVLHFGSKRTSRIEVELSFNEGENQYHLQLEPTRDDSLVPAYEAVTSDDKKPGSEPLTVEIPVSGSEAAITEQAFGTGRYVRDRLRSWRVYHFEDTSASSPMRKTAEIGDNAFLRDDGSNLAAFLYMLQQRHPSEYAMILRLVQLVAPFLESFDLRPSGKEDRFVRLEWHHREDDAYFDAASFSDGTLRFIALAALLLQPAILRPSIILIDEPEIGLHPYALAMLASLIKQASVDTQVIVSTQSAELLDHFEPEDVLVAERVDGGTRLRRLEPEPLEAWLEEYSLGELWRKNEIGGRPGGR